VAEIRFDNSNIACAEAAIVAGLKFFAGYPITPTSRLFEYLTRELPKHGGVAVQCEDEIASINAIIGASWAGAKAMTTTSGPGFSLMLEGIGFAVMTETPIVIIYVMRTGPSTGYATGTGQGDVMQARWGSHGPYEIVVYAPSSAQEAFDLTIKAFNVSELLRIPVVVLTDAVLAHTRERYVCRDRSEVEIIERKRPRIPPDKYKPFKPDPNDLVPPMAVYGEGYTTFAESLVHDERGYYCPKSDVYEKLIWRLHEKVRLKRKYIVESDSYYVDDAEILIVSYGSLSRVALAYVREMRRKGMKIGLFKPKLLWPLDEDSLKFAARRAKKVIVVEMNNGQLYREVDRLLKDKEVFFRPLLKVDLPTVEEFEEVVKECL